jgi:uncharacterized protein with predicted RNA binding PUA domain
MLRRVRVIADYQFGGGVGVALFPDGCSFILSRTGRIRQVMLDGRHLATVRAADGRLTIGFEGASMVHEAIASPAYRVIVRSDVSSVVAEGKNVFARHVVSADPVIQAGDEVMVVASDDELLATGTAVLSGHEMLAFNYGLAVKVREGKTVP